MRSLRGTPTYKYVGATARVREDGWESLGDMGSKDEQGYVYLSDRETDMILVGGSNVYPAEVERLLEEEPGVEESAVVGVPHPDFGEAVVAVVQPAGSFDAGAVREEMRRHATDLASSDDEDVLHARPPHMV